MAICNYAFLYLYIHCMNKIQSYLKVIIMQENACSKNLLQRSQKSPSPDTLRTRHFYFARQPAALRKRKYPRLRLVNVSLSGKVSTLQTFQKLIEPYGWRTKLKFHTRLWNTLTWTLQFFCFGTLMPNCFRFLLTTNRTLSLKSMDDKFFILKEYLKSSNASSSNSGQQNSNTALNRFGFWLVNAKLFYEDRRRTHDELRRFSDKLTFTHPTSNLLI